MTEADYARKMDELDRLLNDPDTPMQPDRIWSLLADLALPVGPVPSVGGLIGLSAPPSS